MFKGNRSRKKNSKVDNRNKISSCKSKYSRNSTVNDIDFTNSIVKDNNEKLNSTLNSISNVNNNELLNEE
jgi:hypothetical protein